MYNVYKSLTSRHKIIPGRKILSTLLLVLQPISCQNSKIGRCEVGWLGFYGISTFVGYLTPNPFLCK